MKFIFLIMLFSSLVEAQEPEFEQKFFADPKNPYEYFKFDCKRLKNTKPECVLNYYSLEPLNPIVEPISYDSYHSLEKQRARNSELSQFSPGFLKYLKSKEDFIYFGYKVLTSEDYKEFEANQTKLTELGKDLCTLTVNPVYLNYSKKDRYIIGAKDKADKNKCQRSYTYDSKNKDELIYKSFGKNCMKKETIKYIPHYRMQFPECKQVLYI